MAWPRYLQRCLTMSKTIPDCMRVQSVSMGADGVCVRCKGCGDTPHVSDGPFSGQLWVHPQDVSAATFLAPNQAEIRPKGRPSLAKRAFSFNRFADCLSFIACQSGLDASCRGWPVCPWPRSSDGRCRWTVVGALRAAGCSWQLPLCTDRIVGGRSLSGRSSPHLAGGDRHARSSRACRTACPQAT